MSSSRGVCSLARLRGRYMISQMKRPLQNSGYRMFDGPSVHAKDVGRSSIDFARTPTSRSLAEHMLPKRINSRRIGHELDSSQ